jgi:hypothetical protein
MSSRWTNYTASRREPALQRYADELNEAFPAVLPPVAYAVTVRRAREDSLLGVFIKDGATVPHGTRLAIYWGRLTSDPPDFSDYVLQLPPAPCIGRNPDICIDARLLCLRGDPPPTQAALLNHGCEDPPLSADSLRLPGCTLPFAVFTTRRSLRGGAELTYNYDARRRRDAFTLSSEEAASRSQLGLPCRPCRCSGLAPCPLRRHFI